MNQTELRALAVQMLGEARALHTAFPDVVTMRELPISVVPQEEPCSGGRTGCAALRYLRDEMLLVRAGLATELTVLNDEITCVEALLRRM